MSIMQVFIAYLQENFPSVSFYYGDINKNDNKCIGIYIKDSLRPVIALGGPQNSSYNIIPVRLLIHWTESAFECDNQALLVYNFILNLCNVYYNEKRFISTQMLDPYPIMIGRAENNICESVVRFNLIYEKGGNI